MLLVQTLRSKRVGNFIFLVLSGANHPFKTCRKFCISGPLRCKPSVQNVWEISYFWSLPVVSWPVVGGFALKGVLSIQGRVQKWKHSVKFRNFKFQSVTRKKPSSVRQFGTSAWNQKNLSHWRNVKRWNRQIIEKSITPTQNKIKTWHQTKQPEYAHCVGRCWRCSVLATRCQNATTTA